MGLDMYLSGRVSAYKSYGKEPDPVRSALEHAAVVAGLPTSANIDFIKIEREVGYWRKANAIHKWFVEHVQDGKDDCGHYYVSREKLTALRDLCQRVLDGSELVDGDVVIGHRYGPHGEEPILEKGKTIADPSLAKSLLPTQEGFFFGGTNYDQWYLTDLAATVGLIDRCLSMPEQVEFQYHSSW